MPNATDVFITISSRQKSRPISLIPRAGAALARKMASVRGILHDLEYVTWTLSVDNILSVHSRPARRRHFRQRRNPG